MAGKRQRTSSSDAGNATVYFSKARQDLGASDVRAVSQKINLDEFSARLEELTRNTVEQGGCSVGFMMSYVEEPLKSKIISVMKAKTVSSVKLRELLCQYGLTVSSADVLRRHRRTLRGGDGCKCPSES